MNELKICVDRDLCEGCGSCIDECPEDVLAMFYDKACLADEDYCDGCGHCLDFCPAGALSLIGRPHTCRN